MVDGLKYGKKESKKIAKIVMEYVNDRYKHGDAFFDYDGIYHSLRIRNKNNEEEIYVYYRQRTIDVWTKNKNKDSFYRFSKFSCAYSQLWEILKMVENFFTGNYHDKISLLY